MFGSSWLVRGLVRGLLWTWAALFQLANWDTFLTFRACLESWLIDITLCYPAVQSQSCDHILNRRRPNLERVFSWVAHRTSSSSTVQLEKPIEWEIEEKLGKKKEKKKKSLLSFYDTTWLHVNMETCLIVSLFSEQFSSHAEISDPSTVCHGNFGVIACESPTEMSVGWNCFLEDAQSKYDKWKKWQYRICRDRRVRSIRYEYIALYG